ncbi:MAG: methyltransferase [Rikenellaceae bacterium]
MFRFKQFAIEQDRTAMKVGTDGVLLGAWCRTPQSNVPSRILDIGAGTGLIALMLAQRSEHSTVVGVEVDEASWGQASENVERSPWSERVEIIKSPIQEFEPKERFDLIVSNPPYFVDSLLSPDASRTNARHTTTLTFEELIVSVLRLLGDGGRFAVVLPTVESQRFDEVLQGRMTLNRRCFVKGREDLEVKRVMSEYVVAPLDGDVEMEELTIERERHQYTDEYKELTRDFYLKF